MKNAGCVTNYKTLTFYNFNRNLWNTYFEGQWLGGGGKLCTTSVYSGCVQMMCVCHSMCVKWVSVLVSNHVFLNNTYSWAKSRKKHVFPCISPGIYYIFPQFDGRNFSSVRSAMTTPRDDISPGHHNNLGPWSLAIGLSNILGGNCGKI